VHTAYTHDGQKVAVKVQHAGLRESCAADVMTIEFLVKAARAVFPDFNYQWLVDETKQNLPLELDFTHEAQNAARCRRNLNSPQSTVASK
jgi:aarF domain-containing kinase